uniref:Secreted protein n=1 Tax=Rhizophora mucronata TaxID=61149 RepID=A0A2P2ISR8_RHIMU
MIFPLFSINAICLVLFSCDLWSYKHSFKISWNVERNFHDFFSIFPFRHNYKINFFPLPEILTVRFLFPSDAFILCIF